MYKVDLHTHSTASPDGGITADQYRQALESGVLDYIAITDHNRIDFATRLYEELGDQIIIGEEIMTSAGEIIGLFLNKPVLAGLTPKQTIDKIREQQGLIYIPHPFETIRKGLHPAALEDLADSIDIVEVCNGRAFVQNRSQQALVWARLNRVVGGASSDAHGSRGLGKTFSSVGNPVTRNNLVQQLAGGQLQTNFPGVRSLLYPKYHRLRKKVRRTK